MVEIAGTVCCGACRSSVCTVRGLLPIRNAIPNSMSMTNESSATGRWSPVMSMEGTKRERDFQIDEIRLCARGLVGGAKV
jgi:hypothetical protein